MIDVVVVYDRPSATVVERMDFVENSTAAFEKRLELERAYRNQATVEVVLLNASSIDDLKVSHSRYFDPNAISAARVKRLSEELSRKIAS
ncbi:MAG: hypothetical protein JO083_02715 [Candidatus Eremiobacteraeota bacterium]|nr:hypothetical protein [Candidatus Eremiobacteraeota bacterium]